MKITQIVSVLYCTLIAFPLLAMQRETGQPDRDIFKVSKNQSSNSDSSDPDSADSSTDTSSSATSTDSSSATDTDDDREQITLDSTLTAVGKSVNLKNFLIELGVICTDNSYNPRKLLGLLKHIDVSKLPDLFSISSQELVNYFNADAAKRCIDLLKDGSFERLRPQAKADALKECLAIDAWKELLKCSRTDYLFSCVIDLCCSVDISREKLKRYAKELKKIKEKSVAACYFDLPAIQAIIQDLLDEKEVSHEHILKTIVCDTPLKAAGCKDDAERFAQTEKLIRLLLALIHAGNNPSLHSFLGCIKWDNVIEKVPELFGFDAEFMELLFDIPKLKKVIRKLQKKRTITKEELLDTLSETVILTYFCPNSTKKSFAAEILQEFVDFDALTKFINSFITDNKKHRKKIKKAFYISKIERLLGIDIRLAFNTAVPEALQMKALMSIAERLGDTRLTYSLPVIGYPLPIILALRALSVHALSSKVGYLTAAAITCYMLYKFGRWMYEKPLSGRALLINTALSSICTNALRALSSWQTTPTGADIIRKARSAYEDHEYFELFEELVKRLTKPQLERLQDRHSLCRLLEPFPAPCTFIDEHEPFIESLYMTDRKNAADRIQLIAAMLEMMLPLEELKFFRMFTRFIKKLTDEEKAELAEESLLMLAYYRPGILYSQPRFIEMIGQHEPLKDGRTLLGLLRVMTEGTKNPNNLVLRPGK